MGKYINNLSVLDAHLKEWQYLSRRLKAQILPALEAQGKMHKSMQSIIEAQNSFQNELKSIFIQQWNWRIFEKLIHAPHFDISVLSQVASQVLDYQKSIRNLTLSFSIHLQKTFQNLPQRTREALLLLGENGWYLDLEISLKDFWQLISAFEEGNVIKAEEALVTYYESRLSGIEKFITERFPHRAYMVRSAFNAHLRREYELSIPVLFAQTDGICKEVIGQYLFRSRNKKPCTAIYIEQITVDSYTAALLSPLILKLPISASENERSGGSSTLNRHTVMHGESLEYGNQINSLKAISLLNYVTQVLEKQEENL